MLKKLGNRKTVSESKSIFHKEFPFVVPAVYRRLVDELIVELNLLSNKEDFKLDALFALGLKNTFNDFTKGYKPIEHSDRLLKSILTATSFSFERLEKLSVDMVNLINTENHYSRITAIGIYNFINIHKNYSSANRDIKSDISDISKSLGYKTDKVQKDIDLYKANLDKVVKALELIALNIEEEKRRRGMKEN